MSLCGKYACAHMQRRVYCIVPSMGCVDSAREREDMFSYGACDV